MDRLQTRLEVLEQQMHTVNRRLRWWQGLACGLAVLALLSLLLSSAPVQGGEGGGLPALERRVAALDDPGRSRREPGRHPDVHA